METYTEKEILGDALASQKAATSQFNLGANECVHDDLRMTMMDLLEKEHEIQTDVFNSMHEKGFYPTPDADMTKVQEAKNKFSGAYKSSL